MIDPDRCEYEDRFFNEEDHSETYYFTYPKDFGEALFLPENEYGNVVGMCVALIVYDGGDYEIMMSPTVEEPENCFSDVDWTPLEYGVNYTYKTVSELLKKVKRI